jgi:GNAT superfamily N-acetyltransferase
MTSLATNSDVRLRALPTLNDADIDALSDVLIDCVDGGASVGFMAPLSRPRAQAFWRGLAAPVAAGEHILFVADSRAGLLGTVQVILAAPDNQPHRGDIAKMLVRARARGAGIGAALLSAAEAAARRAGKSLLVLDTVPGTSGDRLYRRSGWTAAGTIPGYALWPDGRPCDTTVFYKQLDGPGG